VLNTSGARYRRTSKTCVTRALARRELEPPPRAQSLRAAARHPGNLVGAAAPDPPPRDVSRKAERLMLSHGYGRRASCASRRHDGRSCWLQRLVRPGGVTWLCTTGFGDRKCACSERVNPNVDQLIFTRMPNSNARSAKTLTSLFDLFEAFLFQRLVHDQVREILGLRQLERRAARRTFGCMNMHVDGLSVFLVGHRLLLRRTFNAQPRRV
jgi:hypothetical protein